MFVNYPRINRWILQLDKRSRRPLAFGLSAFWVGLVLLVAAMAYPAIVCSQESASDSSSTVEAKSALDGEQNEPLTRTLLSKLLSQRKYDVAIEKVDALRKATPDDPELINLEMSLAMGLRTSKPDIAKKRLRQIIDRLFDNESLTSSEAMGLVAACSYLTQMDRELSPDDQLSLYDRVQGKLAGINSPLMSSAIRSMSLNKTRILISAKRFDEAKILFDDRLETDRKRLDDQEKASIGGYLSTAGSYYSYLSTPFPEEAEAVLDEANSIANAYIQRDDIKAIDFSPYYSIKSTFAMAKIKKDAEQAQATIDEIEASLKALQDQLSDSEAAKLSTNERLLSSLKTRIASALKHHRLIGQLAPEIDAQHFVATDPTSMEALRGKVVLIDFWAVWCGPCIATFPHLIEWHEKYHDQGFVILGATRRYNYRWDSDSNKAVRSSKDEEVTVEDELVMLEKFREQHKLHHGFFVTPEKSKFHEQFGVYGIPQAVLIDRAGKIQMIRTGSGSANAHDLESKIEELLSQSSP